MIIECKQCGSKFKLDEALLREEGSKVRCSVCKATFKAYPQGLAPRDDNTQEMIEQSSGETVALDTPPNLPGQRPEPLLEDNFEAELARALQEDEETNKIEALSPDETPEEEEEDLKFDFEEGAKPGLEMEAAPSTDLPRQIEREPQAREKPEKGLPRKTKKAGLSRFLMIILILVLLLMGGAAALVFFAPEHVPGSLTSFLGVEGKPEVKDPGIRRLSFKAVTGKFYQSSKVGNLFCIQGMIVNNYPGTRSFIRVKGSLLDEKGASVKQKLAFAGNTFSESELKELSLEQINQALANRTGKGNSNVNIKPQASVPFMIVFEGLPDNLSEFTVEAMSSAPGR